MALSLTTDDAQAKINQVDEEMIQVRTLANRILESTQTMTARDWQGGRAQTFSRIMAEHKEQMDEVLNRLQFVVDKGKEDINALAANEAG